MDFPNPDNRGAIQSAKWLQTAANIFDLVYQAEDGEIVGIEVKMTKKGHD